MNTKSLWLASLAVLAPSSGWACLETVLTPAEELARQQAASTMHWGIFFAALAYLVYRARAPLGERIAQWRAKAASFEAAAATRLVTRVTVGFAAASIVLVVYGNIQSRDLPDEGCGAPKLFKTLF